MRFTRGQKAFAQGRLKPGQMNKSEAAYGAHLQRMQNAGLILWFKFEGIKLRLADNTFYTPDFAVLAADHVLECHEFKGFWQDAGRVKIKVASELYPFRFKAFQARSQKKGGGYDVEDFSGIPADPMPVTIAKGTAVGKSEVLDHGGLPF
jgi:hypothetical protein